MPKTRRALTDEQRAERRRADREFAREAVERLRSSEGWQRWLVARRHFHAYSLANQLLIAMQKVASHCLLERDEYTSGPADRVNSRRSAAQRCMTSFAGSGPKCIGPDVAAPPRHLTA